MRPKTVIKDVVAKAAGLKWINSMDTKPRKAVKSGPKVSPNGHYKTDRQASKKVTRQSRQPHERMAKVGPG